MRISPVTGAYRRNSTPQKQVNFGYFDGYNTPEAKRKEKEIQEIMPECFQDEETFDWVRNCPAFVLKRGKKNGKDNLYITPVPNSTYRFADKFEGMCKEEESRALENKDNFLGFIWAVSDIMDYFENGPRKEEPPRNFEVVPPSWDNDPYDEAYFRGI